VVLTSTPAMLDAVAYVVHRNLSKEESVEENLEVVEIGLLV